MLVARLCETLLVAAIAIAAVPAAAQKTSPRPVPPALWAGLPPGAFSVGYRRVESPTGVVHVWFPSSVSRPQLQVRQYLLGDSTKLTSFLKQAGTKQTTIDSLLGSKLFASKSAASLQRAFPLVLVAQGNGGDVFDQVVFCEYLASQGYVVATTPSPMLRMPMEREDQVGTYAELQARELSAAITTVSKLLRVDVQHIGVVAHSFGARAGLLLSMNDARVKAIVSLDGGIGTATATDPFRKAVMFRDNAQLPPLLHFYEELDAFMKPDFAMLRGLRIKSLSLQNTDAMHHTHFTTYGFVVALFPDLATLTRATNLTSRNAVDVSVQTAAFLKQHLTEQ